MSHRHDDSSASSLSAGLSAYNAVEPKPMSTTNSVRSKQSSRSYRSSGGPPPPPRDTRSHHSSSSSRRSSRDPDERSRSSRSSRRSHKSSHMSAFPPPPGGSVRSGGYSKDPSGMSGWGGQDDPDGRQYAPGEGPAYHGNVPPVPEDRSYASSSKGSRSYRDIPPSDDVGSYYSRGSRSQQSKKSGSQLSAEASQFGEDVSHVSNDSRSYQTPSKKAKKLQVRETDNNKRAMWWYNFSRCLTFPIPDAFIRKEDAEAKQAWREKVAICFVVFLASAFFVGIFGFIPVMLCQERTVYTLEAVQERTTENWIAVKGTVYDVTELFERHPTGPAGVEAFLHDDASRMFPRIPPVALPDMCKNMAKFEESEELRSADPVCSAMTAEDKKNGIPCHTFVTGMNATAKYLGEFEQGVQAHAGPDLSDSPFTFWVSIHDRVYNVTDYVNSIRNEQTKQIEKDHPMAYLEPTLNNLVINKLNEDATELFLSVYPDDSVLACMDELFYVGIIDTRFDVVCFVLNVLMYFLLSFVALIMIAQMICSLMYVAKGTRTYSEEDTQDQVIVMVPCYNEGGAELIKTIDSVLGTTYPEENKVVFIIADGVVTGAGQDMSTPEHLAEILGFEMDPGNDEEYDYDSIGLLTSNRARVYHGYYEVEDKCLKYLVVVKSGLPMEQAGSAKPGNRGKRDSQLIIMGYYNRIHYGRELTELDSAIQRAMVDLNLQADMVRFLMAIDADTRVDTMSITHMVYGMDKKEKVLALCGETKVDNKSSSWVTMIQVFEYYNSHHLKKAFEAAFGCVTCLPGCFTMYRIIADDGTPLLPGDGVLYEYSRNDVETLHEKNLYHLGEDRMLTTLLLKHYADRTLTFVPEATCWTIVPHTFRILLSQRRRWINSTVHNMFELLKVNTMCGVCCVSMKVVVFIDLIATMILPASYCYAMYLLFLVFYDDLPVSTVLLIIYGIIMGVQVVVFILRSRWDYLWWFAIYFIVGLPVFYLILPVYSFWNMDDFSWGKTRAVGGSAANNAQPNVGEEEEEEEYDEHEKFVDDNTYTSGNSDRSGYSQASGDRSYASRGSRSSGGSRSYRSRDERSHASRGTRDSRRSRDSESRLNF
mmetsp:Transcript_12488/g.20572  ORF Transcript_12488/g.20572 Transcript_12488/m.20572 type:complete len:1101 (-) Transcript_12488:1600-4902(-)